MSTDERPIAAIATAAAPAAIAVIRLSGSDAVALLARAFSRPGALLRAAGHTIHHGTVCDAAGRPLDEVLVAVYRRPRSYTGEEAAEVFCHGSPAGVRRVYAELLAAGFNAAEPGEFTRRAFLNGKLDLTRAEAVNEVVRAQTAAAHSLAMERLGGAVHAELVEIRAALIEVMATVAIQLDYPEEETGPVQADSDRLRGVARRCGDLAATYGRGRLYQDGSRVVIAGRTNAGKSSLFNRLLRHDRSIVSDVHGTTRDYLEALIDVEGVPVRLFDTAGLRVAQGAIELEGIRRSAEVVAAADLVLYVVDAGLGLVSEDRARLDEPSAATPVLCVMNKIDACPEVRLPPGSVAVSARTGAGIDALNDAIFSLLLEQAGGQAQAGRLAEAGATVIIDSERQRALLARTALAADRAAESLSAAMSADITAVDLQDALDAIGEITGDVATAEILDAMFGSFCVGK